MKVKQRLRLAISLLPTVLTAKSPKSRGKSKERREKKKRCRPFAVQGRIKDLVKKDKTVRPKAQQLILHKTRMIVVHVSDGTVLQKQTNQVDSRVTFLDHKVPRKTVAKREIDVPAPSSKSYHALKHIGGNSTAKEVCSRS